MPTQVQRTASARRRLVAATMALVAEQGAGNTSVAAIGEKAGMSRGAVNFHFGSKDDLLAFVAEEVTADWEARSRKLDVPKDAAPGEAVRAVLRAAFDDVARDEDRFRIFMMLSFEALGPSPHLHEHFARLYRNVRTRTAEVLDELQERGEVAAGVDTNAFAAMLLGLLRGVGYQRLLDPDSVDLDQAYDEILETALARLSG